MHLLVFEALRMDPFTHHLCYVSWEMSGYPKAWGMPLATTIAILHWIWNYLIVALFLDPSCIDVGAVTAHEAELG